MGGVMGMAIAGAVYFIASTISTGSLQGLLIDTPTISKNTTVSINNADADEGQIRRITSRAMQVAAQLEQAAAGIVESAKEKTIATRTAERGEVRKQRFTADGTPVTLTEPPAKGTGAEPIHSGAPLQEVPTEPTPDTLMGATPVVTGTALPSSGFGTTALMVLALLGTAAVTRKRIFGQA